MNKYNFQIIILTLILVSVFSSCKNQDNKELRIVFPKVESCVNPTGIDNPAPVFSWQIESNIRGIAQASYHILVASSQELLRKDEADLWDSGEITSGEKIYIKYAGKPLASGQQCYWKVKIRDIKGKESAWSEPATWSMGLLKSSDWKASWIGMNRISGNDDTLSDKRHLSARMLRKDFQIQKTVKKATAYVCGLGLFEFHINGNKISDQVLVPALSEYNKRSFYLTYDVTGHLNQGTNALGVILGSGRYFAPRKITPAPTTNYGLPRLILQLDLEYSDGTNQTIVSDETWKLSADGPIVSNNEYDGEEYDATREIKDWDKPGFNDSSWKNADLVEPASPQLSAQPVAPMAVMESISPVTMKEIKPGTYIYDMGQNMVGWARLRVKGDRGTKVKLRFSETLKSDGSLYLENIRGANVTDVYTLSGSGDETWEPRFVYHGFRFVEMTGFPGKPDLTALEGRVVYDNIPLTGRFETSDSTINAIYKNVCWGMKGNYKSIPTDCPQRDERQGWLGDRATGSKGESFIFGNSKLYAKWMQDINDAQREDGSVPDVAPTYWKFYSDNVTWPGTYLIVTNMLYDQYGDLEPVRTHYDSFRKWIYYMKGKYLKDGILVKDTYGDWCMPPESQELIHSKDTSRITRGEILGTTFYYHMLTLMQKFAGLLNKTDDASDYKQLADSIYNAYNQKFFNSKLNCYGNNTATANLLSLAFNLVPEEKRNAVFLNIVDKTMKDFNGHISTGLIGAQWIMRMLTQYGRGDIAYKLATNTDYPSWGYMVKNGATTIWELWNGNTADPAMNSGNHLMLVGDLIIWLYEDLAGIKSDPENPGFRNIIMKPNPVGDLKYVKASYQSVSGFIRSEWNKTKDTFEWTITIPPDSHATIYIPAKTESGVKENGKKASSSEGVQFIGMEDGKAIYKLVSGTYHFTAEI